MSQNKRLDILLCCGSGCISAGAKKLKEKIIELSKENNIENEINIIETGCMGPCNLGPVMTIYPEGVFYQQVKVDDIKEIVEEHFI